jgi:citrate synthase
MSSHNLIQDTGLRGISVADTNICLINGVEGELYYRGYCIEDLAKNTSYEEIIYLLLKEDLPNQDQLDEINKILRIEREVPFDVIEHLKLMPRKSNVMNVLQSTIPMLSGFENDSHIENFESNLLNAIRIISKTATIVTSWERIRNGKEPIAPESELSHAANILYMLKGTKPNDDEEKIFDTCLTLHAEHSLNASTFTARVIASTRASIYSCISGAVGSLSGLLHGGASRAVMERIRKIESIDKVDEWVKNQLDSGKRVMGMGHAVYKGMDPRASILRDMGLAIPSVRDGKWFKMVNKIADVTKKEFLTRKGRELNPNVDLFNGSVYHSLGIPDNLYTGMFAVARVAGWSAHVLEEKYPKPPIKPVLYRPSSLYIGNYCGPTGCVFEPIGERT